MTHYLTLPLLLQIAERACGQQPMVREYGLLESALARPATTVFGDDAYPRLHLKAAALFHSLATNHGLVDGNKRLAWAATAVFLWANDYDLDAPHDAAFDLTVSVADGALSDLDKLAERLASWSTPR